MGNEYKNENQKNKPNITDWIQAISAAIGTIFAIFGLIIAWQSLTKNDIIQQMQIDTLNRIAKENIKHTEQLQRQINLKTKEIKPELSIKIGRNDGKLLQTFLSNSGGTAHIKKIIPNKNNNLKLVTRINLIGEGKEKELFFKIINHENPVLDIIIMFVDIDDQADSTRILIEGYKKIFEPEPILELN